MKLSDYVADFLIQIGVKHIFGYQGGSITHLINSFSERPELVYVQNYNEQASAICADVYSRLNETAQGIGVAVASNGPGATNLITGIADSYCDSVPVMFLTGQVHTFAMKKSDQIRQESFQEIDILSMVRPITKYCVTVNNPEKIRYELERAYYFSKEKRPGPVLVDIPVDVQGADIDVESLIGFSKKERKKPVSKDCVKEIILKLFSAKRPLIIAGGGINTGNCRELFRNFVKTTTVPTVVSLQGIDTLPHDAEEFIGFIGTYGNRYANLAVQNADFILVLGSRLDMRQTGKNRNKFSPYAYIVHVDIDINELNHTIKEQVSLQADLNEFFQISASCLADIKNYENWADWKKQIHDWKNLFYKEAEKPQSINPNQLIRIIGEKAKGNLVITADVGQNQMWVAQSLRIYSNDIRIVNSGGLGAMGFSLPAAISACFIKKNDYILCFTGDGGLQMNIQELCVVGANQLPIKIVLLNNYSLGLIRDIHEKYYNKRYIGSVEGFNQPEWEKIAAAYQMGYKKIEAMEDLRYFQEEILNNKKPFLINCILSDPTYIVPELLGNDSLDRQSPYVDSSVN